MSNHPFSLGEEASVAQDLRGSNPAAPRRLVALTMDEVLARSLSELAATGIDVAVVSNAEALSEELLQSTSTTALIDAAAGAGIEGLVDVLATQFPELRLLVAGHGPDQALLATRIASGRVFRFVHKPASAQRLKLMVDAASRQAEPQRISVTQTVQVLPDPALGGGGAARAGGPPERRSPPWLMLGIGAAVVVATAALLFWPDKPAPPAAATPAPATTTQSAIAEVNDLVRRADQAFADGRYVGSDDSSAAELYRDALKADAGDTRARDGFARSIEYGIRSAEQALLAANLDDAARVAEMLRLLAPTNSRLSFLQSQIDREQARANQDASTRAAWEGRQAQIRGNLDGMQQRIGSGALLEPANDSALKHFRAAEDAGPGDVAVRNARDRLLAALLNTADRRVEAGDQAGARRLIDAAASLNSSAPGLDPLRRRLAAMNEAEEKPAAAAPVPEAVASTAPPTTPATATPATTTLAMAAPAQAQSTAAASGAGPAVPEPPQPRAQAAGTAVAAAAAPPVISATSLKRVRTVAPVYPTRALQDLVSGWVDLEFTITAEGTVSDIVIVASEPDRVFDSAATSALRRWRFEPVEQDGVAVEQRARQRISFKAQDE